MSQLAQFFLVDRDRLPELVASAEPKRKLFGKSKSTFPETFDATARELDDDFAWSGYYFGVLVVYLDEKGTRLIGPEVEDASAALTEARGATTFVFTPADKAHLAQLDPAAHDEDELRHFFEEFNEEAEPDAGRAMKDALAALHSRIGDLDDSTVLLLVVG